MGGNPCTRATRPVEGRRPTTPAYEAGRRIEPPASVPSARGARPAASAATAPPLEPPGVSSVFHGLRVGPNTRLSVNEDSANSGVLVLPTMTAPDARTRATATSSCGGL